MNILVGKTFGIGNAIYCIPMIKALSTIGRVDVLVGSTPDDFGAKQVVNELLKSSNEQIVRYVREDFMHHLCYQVAIMSIPYDGRWQNNERYFADRVMDCRPRPDFCKELGFASWKKHEVEYQMENAYELGYSGSIPDCSFLPVVEKDPHLVYVGTGYKRDQAGFWAQKHWGHENFVALIKRMLAEDPKVKIISTGDLHDMAFTLWPIVKEVNDPRFTVTKPGLLDTFRQIARCSVYVGNDTGMMHVAASTGCKTIGIFKLDNSWTKSRPWCEHAIAIQGYNRDVTVDEVYEHVKEYMR